MNDLISEEWLRDLVDLLVRLVELAGAVGLILPAMTRIRPVLTPLAAVGFLTIMSLASGFHVIRGELDALPITFALGGMAGFVAWGRLRKAPILRPGRATGGGGYPFAGSAK
jgi:hypothetical protein